MKYLLGLIAISILLVGCGGGGGGGGGNDEEAAVWSESAWDSGARWQ